MHVNASHQTSVFSFLYPTKEYSISNEVENHTHMEPHTFTAGHSVIHE